MLALSDTEVASEKYGGYRAYKGGLAAIIEKLLSFHVGLARKLHMPVLLSEVAGVPFLPSIYTGQSARLYASRNTISLFGSPASGYRCLKWFSARDKYQIELQRNETMDRFSLTFTPIPDAAQGGAGASSNAAGALAGPVAAAARQPGHHGRRSATRHRRQHRGRLRLHVP